MVQRFKGLEHLSIHMVLDKTVPRLGILDGFLKLRGVMALSKISLKSLQITMEVRSKSVPLTDADIESLIFWLKDAEDKFLGQATNDGRLDQ